MKTITLTLDSPKKHSGKYVVDGTENDRYPQMMYLRREWFDKTTLPNRVQLTIQEH